MQEFCWTGRQVPRRGPTAALLLLILASCGEPEQAPLAVAGPCGSDGGLRTELFGELEAPVRWQGGQLKCEGMPRPNQAGARLRFSGTVMRAGAAAQLAFIFGIPDLERGKLADELPTNVTVIDEGQGRFFSTRDTDVCWSNIERQEATATKGVFVISGILYCVAPLAELNGGGNVRLSDVQFTGLLDWTPQ